MASLATIADCCFAVLASPLEGLEKSLAGPVRDAMTLVTGCQNAWRGGSAKEYKSIEMSIKVEAAKFSSLVENASTIFHSVVKQSGPWHIAVELSEGDGEGFALALGGLLPIKIVMQAGEHEGAHGSQEGGGGQGRHGPDGPPLLRLPALALRVFSLVLSLLHCSLGYINSIALSRAGS